MKDENIFTVSEVNRHLRNVVESNIPTLYVEGEIANFTKHNSGHIYFSLKDANSTLRCVFFRGNNALLRFKPKEGDKVILLGNISIYERGGSYQLNVRKMLQSGLGELQQKFEALKKKLQDEGLFEAMHKKPIPKYPQTVGVVTSATGAAIQDIKNVISRRFPCRILLQPATVQGPAAASEIIRGIEYFQANPVDVLIIGRGGGSQEDLFCFNDEALARTIFACEIPIISAVGHEIDFTISDFVSDLRAPTPSAAAELAVPDKAELLNKISNLSDRMRSVIRHQLYEYKLSVQELETRLANQHPLNKITRLRNRLDNAKMKLQISVNNSLVERRNELEILQNQLKELSPKEILKRGYSFLRLEKKLIRSVASVQIGTEVELILTDGKCSAEIKGIEADA